MFNPADIKEFDATMEALWNCGKTMLMGYAKHRSDPMPPMPDWSELPLEAKAAFGIQSLDLTVDLMGVVESIATVKARRDLEK